MNFASYREILAVAAVRRLIIIGMVARIPHAAAGVLLTLHVVGTMGRSYLDAGAVAAAITVGMAFGAPWRGRRVDIIGLRKALVPSIIVELLVWTSAPFLNYQLLIVAAVIGGMFAIPIFSVIRQALGVMVPPEQRRTAYALDSMAAEVTFMIGPAAGVMMATKINTVVGLVIIGLSVAIAGTVLIVTNPPTRSGQKGAYVDLSKHPDPSPTTAQLAAVKAAASPKGIKGFWGKTRTNLSWINLAILAIFGTALASGLVLNGTNVGMVALLREHNQEGSLGIVFFFWCGASIVGGLVYGALKRSINPMWLLTGMAILIIPMGFATEAWTLGLLSVLPGLLCAPVLTSSAERVADLVEERRRGEAMGWYGSAMTIGGAMGSPFTGAVIDRIGPWAGFVAIGIVAAILGVFGLLVQWFTGKRKPS